MSLYFNITNACNSACAFCAECSPEVTTRRDIPLREAIKALERFQLGHQDDVVINGGEPTIYDGLPELIRNASARQAKVILFTNGRLLKRYEYALTLLKAGVHRLSIPLHGRFPETHDRLTCRPGSFEQTLAGLRNVHSIRAETGYPRQIELKVLAVRQSLPEWPAIIDLVAPELGSQDILLMSGLNMWCSAVVLYNQIAPTLSEMQYYVNQALDRAVVHGIQVVLWSIPLCLLNQVHIERFKSTFHSTSSNLQDSTQIVYFDPDYPECIEMPDFDFHQRCKETSCQSCTMFEMCGPGSTFMQQLLAVSG